MKKKKNTLFQVKKWTELTYYYSVIGEEEYYSIEDISFLQPPFLNSQEKVLKWNYEEKKEYIVSG